MNKLFLLVLSPLVLLFGGRAAHAVTSGRTVTVQVIRTDGKVHDGNVTVYFVDAQGQQRRSSAWTDDRGVARMRLPEQLGSNTVYVTAGYISDLWCERQTVSMGDTRLSIVYRGRNPDWMLHSCSEDHDF